MKVFYVLKIKISFVMLPYIKFVNNIKKTELIFMFYAN